jgi:hypothetical protein
VLRDMEKNSDALSYTDIPTTIPVLDLMAEHGPWPTEAENEQFKQAQQNFIKRFNNKRLVFAKGSEHNIVGSKPALLTGQIITFYKRYH